MSAQYNRKGRQVQPNGRPEIPKERPTQPKGRPGREGTRPESIGVSMILPKLIDFHEISQKQHFA